MNKPFDKAFVLQATIRNMHKDIDFSLRKTFDRFEDFEGNEEKRMEIFETLSVLNKMHKLLDEFSAHNEHLFDKKDTQ